MSDLVPSVLREAGPLLALPIVIAVGIISGALARRFGLPGVTGQILAGIAIGEMGLSLFSPEALSGLEPLTHLAIGLIAVTSGAHLNLERLRNARRRLGWLLLLEATLTPLFVFVAFRFIGGATVELSVLFATIAIATAPATIVAIVRETRSKGLFTKTLIAAVALNNIACIALFEFARTAYKVMAQDGIGADAVFDTLLQLVVSCSIGVALGVAMHAAARLTTRPDALATTAIVALLVAYGLPAALGVSPLLTCLVLGIAQTNLTRSRSHLVDSVFSDFEPAILAVFFTLAGVHLSFEHAGVASLAAILLFFARGAGKLAAARLAMTIARATPGLRRHLGPALIPQAGVAVGLLILIQDDPAFASISGLFGAVVLTVVTANEIVGPFLARASLARAGEIGKDRTRLIDFLQEEHIATGFRAESKEAAIATLVDLMVRTHGLEVDRETLLQSVLAREREGSTCFGEGLAVPHGILPDGTPMAGVMALSRDGLDFETPDGRPVHCMVLLCTASDERDRHLEVLAGLARTVGGDPAFREQLVSTHDAGHAYELLHGEESEHFNYFLDEE